MLEFICPSCGKRVQGDDSFAGKHVLCPACNTTFTIPQPAPEGASPATGIATAEHASEAKLPTGSSNGSFREGEPAPSLPSVARDVPRVVMGWVPIVIVINMLVISALLLLHALQKVRTPSSRTQSTNNLKNIGLAFHSFHDANKRLPFNGTVPAVANDPTSGSWAFQILPYIDQGAMFAQGKDLGGVASYMCPPRGRPIVCTTGPWTDYFINSWINDPVNGKVNAADNKTTWRAITDGTSNTILVGQGTIDPQLYKSDIIMAQSTDILKGGDPATARRSMINQRDSSGNKDLNWGSPFSQGSLMCLVDATVRMFPYQTNNGEGDKIINGQATGNFAPFLTPAGGEEVLLPD